MPGRVDPSRRKPGPVPIPDFKCPENGFVTTAESHRNLVKSNLSTETLSTKPDLTKDEEKIISEILNSENFRF